MLDTKVLSIDDPKAVSTAKQIIEDHGLIAFPTDTIYGVAGDPFNTTAIRKIYAVKERPQNKALPVLIGERCQLKELVVSVSELTRLIAEAFWPGALTLILPKGPLIPRVSPPLSSCISLVT